MIYKITREKFLDIKMDASLFVMIKSNIPERLIMYLLNENKSKITSICEKRILSKEFLLAFILLLTPFNLFAQTEIKPGDNPGWATQGTSPNTGDLYFNSLVVGSTTYTQLSLNPFRDGSLVLSNTNGTPSTYTFSWTQSVTGAVPIGDGVTADFQVTDRDTNATPFVTNDPYGTLQEIFDNSRAGYLYNLHYGANQNATPEPGQNFTLNLKFGSGQFISPNGDASKPDFALFTLNESAVTPILVCQPLDTSGNSLGSSFSVSQTNRTVFVNDNPIYNSNNTGNNSGVLSCVGISLTNLSTSDQVGGFSFSNPMPAFYPSSVFGVLANPTPEPCSMIAFAMAGGVGCLKLRRKRKKDFNEIS